MSNHPYLLPALISFLLGLATGSLLFRSDFCIAGMFRDFFLFRQTFMLRVLLLLVTASLILFEILRLLGLLSAYPFPGLGPPALTTVAGGLLFGIGMVLAGGCVIGTLYKMGRGLRGSWIAFAGLLLGSTLYAEIHPAWAALAAATRLTSATTLSQLLGVAPTPLLATVAALAGGWLWRRRGHGGLLRASAAVGDLQPRTAALWLALIGAASWLLLGMPLGITTIYAKSGAWAESLLWPQHLASLTYYQGQPLVFRPPLAGVPLASGAGPQFDLLAAMQLPLVVGIVLGSFCSAWYWDDLAKGGHLPWRQILSALSGGILMGLAARLAPACNVWHLLGGLPILALQSLLFLGGLVPGAWIGSRLLTALVLKP